MAFIGFFRMIAFIGICSICAAASPQSFKAAVFDALNGRPQAGVEIHYFCAGRSPSLLNSPEKFVLTDAEGSAQVPYECVADSPGVEIYAIVPGNNEYQKEECGSVDVLRIGKILSDGFISDPNGAGNIWCPRRISKRLKPIPGEVILFIKKPTWWQVHVAG